MLSLVLSEPYFCILIQNIVDTFLLFYFSIIIIFFGGGGGLLRPLQNDNYVCHCVLKSHVDYISQNKRSIWNYHKEIYSK